MTHRAALIGCGRIGTEFVDDPRIKGVYTHAGAYMACPRTELVAVCDIDAPKASRCGRRWGVAAVYADAARLMEEQRPEIVSICSPDATHGDVLGTVLQATGVRAVLTEKPLAIDLYDAHKLIRMAEERDIVLAVNYSRRYSDGHRRVKEMIESGRIGNVQKVAGLYTNGILHNGSHWFDLARWLIGDMDRVQGFGVERHAGVDPTLDVWLRFETGPTGFLQGCRAQQFTIFEMDVVGSYGRMRLVESGHRVELFDVGDNPYYSGYRSLRKVEELCVDLHDTLLNAVEDLVNCLEGGGQPRCSGADGLAALRLASAAATSALEGVPVELNGGER